MTIDEPSSGDAFTVDDFDRLTVEVLAAWRSGVDRDWSVPAGTLEWSCWDTADHTIDCVFSYALFLASRKQDDYPPFGELHALPEATSGDLVDGLLAVCNLLSGTIRAAGPEVRAVIFRHPQPTTAPAADFAARGALEMVLHAHDVCVGLGVAFVPSADLCRRLWEETRRWPTMDSAESTEDPWSDLLQRSGRTRVN